MVRWARVVADRQLVTLRTITTALKLYLMMITTITATLDIKNVYAAVIMTEALQPVHPMNAEQCQTAADPYTQTWGCEFACIVYTH